MAETSVHLTDSRSRVLGLRLVVEGTVIGHYREDTGAKLLSPDELVKEAELQRYQVVLEQQRADLERQRAQSAEQENQRLRARLEALGLD